MNISKELCISEKIVGRDEEIEELQAMYRRVRDSHYEGSSKALSAYIKGLSGIGKSFLVVSALKDLVADDGGFFCEGKFDSMNSHRPFSAVVDALDSFCSKALNNIAGDEEKQEQLQLKIRGIIGDDEASALTSLLPTIARILRNDRAMQDTSASSALSAGTLLRQSHQALKHSFYKLKEIVTKLVQLLAEDKPLVLFIDDLQVRLATFGILSHLSRN